MRSNDYFIHQFKDINATKMLRRQRFLKRMERKLRYRQAMYRYKNKLSNPRRLDQSLHY